MYDRLYSYLTENNILLNKHYDFGPVIQMNMYC